MAKCLPLVKQGAVINGIFFTPILYVKNASGKRMFWQGIVYSELDGNRVDISAFLPSDENPYGIKTTAYGYYYTLHGQVDGKVPSPSITEVKVGTHKGTKSEISAVVAAINKIHTTYSNKINKGGYSTSQEEVAGDFESLYKAGRHRIFLEKMAEYSKHSKKLANKYPLMVQRKYNGTTICAVYHPTINSDNTNVALPGLHIDMFLRGRTTFHQGINIAKELQLLGIEKYPGVYFVGELYLHGENLEDISGAARLLEQAAEDPSKGLKCFLFDCFDLANPETPFCKRYDLLHEMFSTVDPISDAYSTSGLLNDKLNFCKLVETYLANDEQELLTYYNTFIREGYEGAVVRTPDAINKSNQYKTAKSYQVMKIKPFFDMEVTLVDYTEGKGKNKGVIKFICAIANGNTFRVQPSGTVEEKKALFEKMPSLWETHYKGKLYKIKYAFLSKNGIPQQPVGLGLRDPATMSDGGESPVNPL